MTFAEKLDFLMNITNTSNSTLARIVLIDASAISRLRRGIRPPSRKATYIEPMADYFARTCQDEYQKIALYETIKKDNPHLTPPANETINNIIYDWLSNNQKTTFHSLDEFMDDVINFRFKKMPSQAGINIEEIVDQTKSEVEAFYGKEGKQNAVLVFLSLVLKNNKPQTLLLYSNEDIDWLADPKFVPKWASLMAQIIMQGNRIKVIHSINRTFDEMLSGIKQWIPLYMTGAIEPYYYPKTQDGLFRQTFFIAPETAAITSSSVSSKTENAANFLYTNKKIITSLVDEYNSFLYLCRPLMRIFTPHNKQEEFLAIIEEFENETSNTIIKTDTLTDISMPLDVVKSFLEKIPNIEQEKLLTYHLKRVANIADNLSKYSFIEIFTLPSLELILTGKVAVNFSDILNNKALFYSPEEYLKHLKNLIRILDTYNNYHIILTKDNYLEGSIIYVKEDVGVFVAKTWPPSIVFAINETNMVAAFWDYMNNILNKNPLSKQNRLQTTDELKELIFSIEATLL
ncbi:MAG TPA: transcriptional regulator [Syntrophomonadaceae bacterium]|nr:transcriptional regulator [Syntrophomonadaceae bacterium]